MLQPSQRSQVLEQISDEEALQLLYDWNFWARTKQVEPTRAYLTWLLLSGRGWGKTRTGSEWVRKRVNEGYRRIALIGETKADVRDLMIEVGDSSLLKTSPPWEVLDYEPSKRRLTWYTKAGKEKAVAIAYSGDEPDQLRGAQHDCAWVDELAKYRYPQDTWDMLEFGLRLGNNPKAIVTTTPRPIKTIKELAADPQTVVTVGNTIENKANLSAMFMKRIYSKYGGTRLGRQELAGQILDDNPEALWDRGLLDKHRVSKHPELKRIVVAVDPQARDLPTSAETGIIAAGLGIDDEGYIISDDTIKGKPDEWGKQAVSSYTKWKADRMVGEINNGGDMIEYVIRSIDKNISYSIVRATRGKTKRAEPISALYEQGRVHHVGCFTQLEDQMCEWNPNLADREQDSPDRMDALVWALTELMLDAEPEFMIGRA